MCSVEKNYQGTLTLGSFVAEEDFFSSVRLLYYSSDTFNLDKIINLLRQIFDKDPSQASLSESVTAEHLEILLKLLAGDSPPVRKLATACLALLSVNETVRGLLMEVCSAPAVSGMFLLSQGTQFLPFFLKHRDSFSLPLPQFFAKKKLLWVANESRVSTFDETEIWELAERYGFESGKLPDPFEAPVGLFFEAPAKQDPPTLPSPIFPLSPLNSFSSSRTETMKRLIVRSQATPKHNDSTQFSIFSPSKEQSEKENKFRLKLASFLLSQSKIRQAHLAELFAPSERKKSKYLLSKSRPNPGGSSPNSQITDFSFLIKKKKK